MKAFTFVVAVVVIGVVRQSKAVTLDEHFTSLPGAKWKLFACFSPLEDFFNANPPLQSSLRSCNVPSCTAFLNLSTRKGGVQLTKFYYAYSNCLNDYNLLEENVRADFLQNIGSVICSLKRNKDCRQQPHGGYKPIHPDGTTCSGVSIGGSICALAHTMNRIQCIINSGAGH